MAAEILPLKRKVEQLVSEVALLNAQNNRGKAPTSPWLPIKEAAALLHFSSARALRNRINKGQFPPECYRVDPTSNSCSPKYLINVERYIKQLH